MLARSRKPHCRLHEMPSGNPQTLVLEAHNRLQCSKAGLNSSQFSNSKLRPHLGHIFENWFLAHYQRFLILHVQPSPKFCSTVSITSTAMVSLWHWGFVAFVLAVGTSMLHPPSSPFTPTCRAPEAMAGWIPRSCRRVVSFGCVGGKNRFEKSSQTRFFTKKSIFENVPRTRP